MNIIKLTGNVISIRISTLENQKLVANVLLCDYQSPKRQVYKVSFWGNDAELFSNGQVTTKDELCLEGMIFTIVSNKHGSYIEIRNCKLLDIIKVTKEKVFHTDTTEKTGMQSQGLLEEGDPNE